MIVIKYGGHVLDDPSINQNIIPEIATYHRDGGKVVVVHGGGPSIEGELKFHNIPTSMVGGYRVTTPEVMEVVQRTLSGSVLRDLTNTLIGLGVNAVGLSTGDGNTLRAHTFQPIIDGATTDVGLVGEAQSVDPTFLNLILENGYLPVISPVAVSTSGQALNINGDIAAGAIAGALGASEILFITDVAGIYKNWPDPTSLIHEISSADLREISSSFADGMAPKVRAVLNALSSGAQRARIIDGRNPTNLSQAFKGIGGTVVYA